MPLVTKNGSLINKSGSLAEDCSCCVTVTTLCQLGKSIAVSTSGTASGLWSISLFTFPCPDNSYSVSASGSGGLYFSYSSGTPINSRSICSYNGMSDRCGFVGSYELGSAQLMEIVLMFFSVGTSVRCAAVVQVSDKSAQAVSACRSADPKVPISQGGTATYQGCSDVVGTLSPSGDVLVDFSTVAPLTLSGGGSLPASSGSVMLSFNPLP